MAYLDSSHSHERHEPLRLAARIALFIGLIAFGWFVMTVGTDPNGVPVIVPEPVAQP